MAVRRELGQARDVRLREGLEREVTERIVSPQRERPAQRGGRHVGGRRQRPPAFAGQPLEPHGVDALEVDAEHVSRLPSHEVAAGRTSEPLRLERIAQARDVRLQQVLRAAGHLNSPQDLEQVIGRDHAVRVDQQRREQQSRLAARQLDRRAVADDLQRAQHPELQWARRRSSHIQVRLK
jgi:hypothetical protein